MPVLTFPLDHLIDGTVRYLRVEFIGKLGPWPSLANFAVFDREKPPGNSRYRLSWDEVIYQPGELKAVACRGNEKIGEDIVRTSNRAARLVLSVDRPQIQADGYDLAYVTIQLVDAQGTLCPTANLVMRFKVSGPVTIAGVDNGDPQSIEPMQGDRRSLFSGKALVILRSKRGEAGWATLTVSALGLPDVKIDITTKER